MDTDTQPTLPLDLPSEGQQILFRPLSEIEPEPMEWLWAERIPLGLLTFVVGEACLGKSQLLAFVASVVTRGGEWPDGTGNAPQGKVLMLAAEDDYATAVVPRLMAAAADLDLVMGHQFQFQQDEEALLRALGDTLAADTSIRLILVDPIRSFVPSKIFNDPTLVRAFFPKLQALAARYGVALVLVDHLSKFASKSALDGIRGTVDYGAQFRAGFGVARHPDDPDLRCLTDMKPNYTGGLPTLGFFFNSVLVGEGIKTSAIEFEPDPIPYTKDELFGRRPGGLPSRTISREDEAKAFLLDVLASGPLTANEIYALGDERGVKKRTIERAKGKLKIECAKTGQNGAWVWSLPT
jgi:putative DNA primase/helicase